MRAVSTCSLLCVVLIAMPAGAAAQSLPSDPEADSPSGAVYELPVDRARKDAAPRGGSSPQNGGDDSGSTGGGSTGGGSNGSTGAGSGGEGIVAGSSETSIRSENNFGTSSRVPGAGSRPGGGATGAGGAGEGSNGAVEGLGELAPSSAASAADGPSDGIVFLLLATVLGVGGLIGVVAARRAARDQRG